MALITNLAFNPHKMISPFGDSDLRSSHKVSMASTLHSSSMNLKEPFKKVTHSLQQERREILVSLNEWIGKNILVLQKDIEKSWQPSDFLPDSASEGYEDQVKELKERSKEIPDDCLVALVGHMITEEALPTYQTFITTSTEVKDANRYNFTSFYAWTRGWTAEENRHGDLLNRYLYLSGRVDMKQIEKTIHYLIASGMDVRTESDPFLGLIYVSFQERATFISHGNTARLAKQYGDLKLAQICGVVAADEKRHEAAYTRIVGKLFEIDPDGMVRCLADMMKKKIVMPAHMMYDGVDENLFGNFAAVAQRIGVYTANDYTDIMELLLDTWGVEKLMGLSDEGRRAQDYLCGLVPRFRKLEEKAQTLAKVTSGGVPFSWIFGRKV